MTTPKIRTISRGGSRWYVSPIDQTKVIGVTSIINLLPKDFLQYWSAKMAAEFAVDNVGTVVQMVLDGHRDGAVDLIKGASRRYTNERADIGTAVHGHYETLARGEKLPNKIDPVLEPYLDHWHQFVKDFRPKFLMNEETVWNTEHGYAGSFDGIAEIGGEIVILDFKTSKSAYPEVALQLSAYRHAEFIVRPDGMKVPMPKITGGAVLHVTPDECDLIPVKCDEEIFKTFVGLKSVVHPWLTETSKSVLGHPLRALYKDAE